MSSNQNGMSINSQSVECLASEHHTHHLLLFRQKQAFTMKIAFCLFTLLAGASAFGMSLSILKI
jgi:hypothetical protein